MKAPVQTALCATLIALAAAGCAADKGGSTKAGGSGPPVVLRIGTADFPGRPAADAIQEFARQVDQLSKGKLQIEPVWRAAGEDVEDWDQRVARKVVSAELGMGLIPTRAWDTEGVTSMRALQAPFLVTSDKLVDSIVVGDLATQMLAGLDTIGVTGLTLMPESLRHPFSFADPLVAPANFAGIGFWAPNSAASYALYKALGAVPDDLVGAPKAEAISSGSIVAVESSYLGWAGPKATTVTGNATFFPKVNVLVANSKVFAALSDEQRATLRTAAARTLDWARGHLMSDAAAAQAFCEGGRGAIVNASEADLAALEKAAQPVYADLEKDDGTAALIDKIRELKATAPPTPPVPACGDVGQESGTETSAIPNKDANAATSALNGVYRYEVTKDFLVEKGVDPGAAEENSGVHTVTMNDGEFTDAWSSANASGSCSGRYTSSGNRFTFRWQTVCTGDVSMSLTVEGDQLIWSEVESLPPYDDAEYQVMNSAVLSVPWVRVD
jgi:TRAP-type C4-dicarboxylate transport system substrate-binding protein